MPSWADRLRRLLGRPRGGVQYWERRARKHGARSVLNLHHGEEEIETVTRRQLEILLPLLRSQLRGDERVALDFGCGTGRFSGALADTISGSILAVDPVEHLLHLAPPHPQVAYRRMDRVIPMETARADLVWICLVLGTIVDARVLQAAGAEIERVLRPGGLLFLVENTAAKPDISHFRFRSEQEYIDMWPAIAMRPIGHYEDAGERISVVAGRKVFEGDALRPAKMEIRSSRS